MNLHLDRYLAGAAFFVGTRHRKGKTFRVFDRTLRWRSAAQAMKRRGYTRYAVAVRLNRPRSSVDRVLSFGFRFGL